MCFLAPKKKKTKFGRPLMCAWFLRCAVWHVRSHIARLLEKQSTLVTNATFVRGNVRPTLCVDFNFAEIHKVVPQRKLDDDISPLAFLRGLRTIDWDGGTVSYSARILTTQVVLPQNGRMRGAIVIGQTNDKIVRSVPWRRHTLYNIFLFSHLLCHVFKCVRCIKIFSTDNIHKQRQRRNDHDEPARFRLVSCTFFTSVLFSRSTAHHGFVALSEWTQLFTCT